MSGKLYVCGTPIGNLEDMTLRALRVLNEANVIYAEDTRHSVRLLNHFDISKPLYSYHEHNLEKAGQDIVHKIQQGEVIALISDAGMPGISDPGADIIKKCIELDLPFEIIPGVTAFTTALVGSGLSTTAFTFEGFLDREKKQKKKQLDELKHERRTLIFYESPHRLKDTLKLMKLYFGEERRAVVARELTKKFETYQRGSFDSLCQFYDENEVRGEIVLVVEGDKDQQPREAEYWDSLSVIEHVVDCINKGMDKKEALKKVALQRGMKKSDVYAQTMDALKKLDL